MARGRDLVRSDARGGRRMTPDPGFTEQDLSLARRGSSRGRTPQTLSKGVSVHTTRAFRGSLEPLRLDLFNGTVASGTEGEVRWVSYVQ